MKLFFAQLALLCSLIVPVVNAAASSSEPSAKPASIEEKKQEFVSQLNATCLAQTDKLIGMVDSHGVQRQANINKQQVCTCVGKKMREDKYLRGLYTTDKTNPFQGYDKLKFKQYMGARHTAFLMTCVAPELEKASAEMSPLQTP